MTTAKKIGPVATVAEQNKLHNKLAKFDLWDDFLKLCRDYERWWKKHFPKQEISSSIAGHLLSILFKEMEVWKLPMDDKKNLTFVLEKAKKGFRI